MLFVNSKTIKILLVRNQDNNCYIQMQGGGERLWKQINSQPIKNMAQAPKITQTVRDGSWDEKQKVQQNYCRKDSRSIQDHSFGKLDISEIEQQNNQENEIEYGKKTDLFNCSNLENLLNEISESNKNKHKPKITFNEICSEQNQSRDKYRKSCFLFLSILKNFKYKIEQTKKSVVKQIQKSHNFQKLFFSELVNEMQKMQASLKDKSEQIVGKDFKIAQLSTALSQLNASKLCLEDQNSQLREKICEFCVRIKKESTDRLLELQKILAENKRLKQVNFELNTSNLNLRQKIITLERGLSNKIKQNQQLSRNMRIQQLEQKIKNSTLLESRFSSKIKQFEFQKSNRVSKNVIDSNMKLNMKPMVISRKISQDSDWQVQKDEQMRRKTFSNYFQINKAFQTENGQEATKRISNQKYSLQISPQISKKNLTELKFNRKNTSEDSYQRYNNRRSDCKVMEGNRERNFGLMSSKLNQMKSQIEDEIKNLKNSISTTNT